MNERIERPAKADVSKRRVYFKDGRMYFDRGTERFFYFALTMLILLWGLAAKMGWVTG